MARRLGGITKHRARKQWDVLLAEDQDDYALLIETALERASPVPVEFHRAADGEEALAMVVAHRPDFILLDLMMPGLSGHEVLEALKSHDVLSRIPVVVVTSSNRDEDVARSYGLGSNHFITKPNDPVELERQLSNLLRHMDGVAGRGGDGSLQGTAVSADNASSIALRKAFVVAAVAATLILLLGFAYLMGMF